MIAMLDPQKLLAQQLSEVQNAVATARSAQMEWAQRSTRERARLIGALRPLLADEATRLGQITAAVGERPVAEKIVSEVLPLVEACRFLEKNAARILRSRRFGRSGRPMWLQGSTFEVHRKPFGVILIVGPSNYPLFIPAVQMLHALAAGNAVLIKPAPESTRPISHFVEHVISRSKIPRDLVQILPEATESAHDAVQLGIDKAVFTGSSENGRDFLGYLAECNTPSIMELSGADAVFVRADADIELAAKAIAFGFRLNAGNTCMAPHAVFVHVTVASALAQALTDRGLRQVKLVAVRDDAEALEIARMDQHGLGAAIFSKDEAAARRFAAQLRTGFATINDIIVPTADPRFPFGGVRESGFGTTRGAEGLLEMTYPHAVAVRRARFLPHLDEPQAGDEELFAAFIRVAHGRGVSSRWAAMRELMKAGRGRMQKRRQST
jgi:acyl-CoA reductase-like NAD-dependent aldehyde dehydrogenase